VPATHGPEFYLYSNRLEFCCEFEQRVSRKGLVGLLGEPQTSFYTVQVFPRSWHQGVCPTKAPLYGTCRRRSRSGTQKRKAPARSGQGRGSRAHALQVGWVRHASVISRELANREGRAGRRGHLWVACPGPPFRPEKVEGLSLAGVYFVYDRPDSQRGPASCPRQIGQDRMATPQRRTVLR
jgi:hypothetical protein